VVHSRFALTFFLFALILFKLYELILGKIIKIAATRCHIWRLKCTKFDFGYPQILLGELTAHPQAL